MSALFFIVLLLVVALVVFFLYKSQKTSNSKANFEKAMKMSEEILRPERPEDDIEQIQVDLLEMNVKVRITEGFNSEMLQSFERLVDKLGEIIPKMSNKWPTDDLTWETARIATKHLPDFLQKFLSLTADQLSSRKAEFLDSIQTIEVEVDEVMELFATNAVNEARTRARIIKRKFEQAPSEGV